MSVSIRRSSASDASAIAAIAEKTFGEPFYGDRIDRLLKSGRNYSLVALDAQGILAFADNFITVSETGTRRLELDLLAVEPKARGMGIGRRLIAESLLLARELDARLLRALVRSENDAMRRLCDSCGFAMSEQSYDLYVRSAGPGSQAPLDAKGTHLVPVETLAYSGIWIEGCLTRAGILRALSHAATQQLQRVGVLVAQTDRVSVQLLADYGFQRLGTYDWWTLKLKNG
ncbi:MAG: GNAT family N-acetyltransferase [Chloroflexi bacterium]|nr:GNAT family N-acetyltransferase [Chloroflexota bacterium]